MILREEGSGTKYAAERLLEIAQEARVIMRSNDQEAIKHMVADGAGITIISAYAAADMAESGKILTFRIGGEAPRSFWTIYRKDAVLSDAEREYIGLAEKIYGSDEKIDL